MFLYREDISRLPDMVSLAGVDDNVLYKDMRDLSLMYYIDWGVLCSPSRFGTKRYPSRGFIRDLANYAIEASADEGNDPENPIYCDLNLTLHLCGDYVTALLEDGYMGDEELLRGFRKVQINAGRLLLPDEYARLREWARNYKVSPIFQVPEFPDFREARWDRFGTYLLDGSGGKGITPDKWQSAWVHGNESYISQTPGYAGGIGPDNVLGVCHQIIKNDAYDSPYYYIDMESKLRDEDDEFSMEKAKHVCEKLWGLRAIDHTGRVTYLNDMGLPEDDNEGVRINYPSLKLNAARRMYGEEVDD